MAKQDDTVDSGTGEEEFAPKEASAEATVEPAPAVEPADETGAEGGGGLIDQDEYKTLQQELEQALAQAEDNWNQFLRAKAEMENLRRRTQRDLENAHKYGLEKFARELLPVRDSLEMGIAAAQEESTDAAKLLEGKELTLKMLTTTLEKYGIQEVNPVGDKFNPDVHEAMATQPSSEAEPNTVMQVIQKGYLLNDRVIRPAMVIVSRAAEESGG